jgi:hypothetical protein
MKSPSLVSLSVVSRRSHLCTRSGMRSITGRGNDHSPYIPILFYRMSLKKTCEEAETGLKVFQLK